MVTTYHIYHCPAPRHHNGCWLVDEVQVECCMADCPRTLLVAAGIDCFLPRKDCIARSRLAGHSLQAGFAGSLRTVSEVSVLRYEAKLRGSLEDSRTERTQSVMVIVWKGECLQSYLLILSTPVA